MSVSIYTISDNRPDFIPWQKETFDHFLKDPYEFFVVNNASLDANAKKVRKICNDLGITCIELPEKHHESPNIANAYPADYLIHNYISRDKHSDVSILIDSDMFLMKEFSPRTFLGNNWLSALPQRRGPVKYLWIALVMINHKQIQDLENLSFCCTLCAGLCPYYDPSQWYWGTINGQKVDVGGATYFYLHAHRKYKVKELWSTHDISLQRKNLQYLPLGIRRTYNPEYRFQILNQTFFHYTAGSNWRKQSDDFHSKKSRLAREFIDGVMDGKLEMPRMPAHKKYIDPVFHWSQYRKSIRYYWKSFLSRCKQMISRLLGRGGKPEVPFKG
jgi:hypothetical protein